MKERIKKSIFSITGTNISVSESKKSIENKKKKKFLDLVNSMKDLHLRANELHMEYGINLFYYEDAHYQLLESLLEEIYSRPICKVVFWWVYDADDPKSNNYKVVCEKTQKEYKIKTTLQLYNTLKKMKLIR